MPLTIIINSWLFAIFLLVMAIAICWTCLTGVIWVGNLGIASSMLHFGGQPVHAKQGQDAVFQMTAAARPDSPFAPQRPAGFGMVFEHQSGLSICGQHPPPKLERGENGTGKMRLVYPREHVPAAAYGMFVVRDNLSGYSEMLTENVGWGLPAPIFESPPAKTGTDR